MAVDRALHGTSHGVLSRRLHENGVVGPVQTRLRGSWASVREKQAGRPNWALWAWNSVGLLAYEMGHKNGLNIWALGPSKRK